MKHSTNIIGFLMSILLVSCNNEKGADSATGTAPVSSDTLPAKQVPTAVPDSAAIMKELQGKWKERAYPFRLAHFENATVKFTEEGVVEEPRFREFTISGTCPFNVNNIRNTEANEMFLVMTEKKTCERLTVAGDSLVLSGFNVSSNADYRIVYDRIK